MRVTAHGIIGMMLTLITAGLALPASGGIPEPGVILYGQVFDESGNLLTDGALTWTFTPENGLDPVSLNTSLTSIDAAGGPFSYRITVPFETAVSGFPAESNSIPLSDTPVTWTRNGAIAGTGIAMTHTITLSASDRATAQRVDVCLTCAASNAGFHAADTNKDFRFSEEEILRVIDLYTGGEYHCDPATSDGYAAGTGARNGLPHSADWYETDTSGFWRITLPEVLRMIDLYNSTDGHGYIESAASDDGFGKLFSQDKDFDSIETETAPGIPLHSLARDFARRQIVSEAVYARRTLRGGARNSEAGTMLLDMAVEISTEYPLRLSAVGIQETLPAEWQVASVTDSGLAVAPQAGESGTLDFAWLKTPAMPCLLEYRIEVPADTDPLDVLDELSGVIRCRTVTGKQETVIPVETGEAIEPDGRNQEKTDPSTNALPRLADASFSSATAAPRSGFLLPLSTDTDGDGLPDSMEGRHDTDGDGYPDMIDIDSDNDGLNDDLEVRLSTSTVRTDTDNDGVSDFDEVTRDGSASTSTSGTQENSDLDPLNPDTDNDGFTDGQEITFGTDPLNLMDAPESLPVAPAGTLLLLTGLLMASGAITFCRARRKP